VTNRRVVIFLFAAAVAAVAGVATYGYLTTVQERANHNARLVKVFVVKHDIAKGTPGENALDEGWVQPDQINARFRASTALTDINLIRGKVAVIDLPANQVMVDGLFVDPRVATVSAAQRIPQGNVAITIRVDEVHGVANLVQPGDKVNMLVLARDGTERYLFQNVPVLFVGSQPAPAPGEATPTTVPGERSGGGGLITVAARPDSAARIAFAAAGDRGDTIHLTLNPPDYEPESTVEIRDDNLFATTPTPD
jgi:pilus assembly protein CpaB